MKQQKTPWYPGSTKPVRVGWYDYFYGPQWVTLENFRWYVTRCFWDGKVWLHGPRADGYWDGWRPSKDDQWRGLTRPAKGKA